MDKVWLVAGSLLLLVLLWFGYMVVLAVRYGRLNGMLDSYSPAVPIKTLRVHEQAEQQRLEQQRLLDEQSRAA